MTPPLRVLCLRSRLGPGALVAALLTAACGDSPTGPTTPAVDGPTISCPANQSVRTANRTATVNFPAPTVTGGVAPITVGCTPPSGWSFSIGTTQTACVATDSRQRFGRCTFNVTVDSTPVLSVTRFVAFGDSITEGKLADGNFASTP